MEKPYPTSIPITPGVYLYKDSQGRIIYVGKARNLRKRILSYFREGLTVTPKTKAMMNHVELLETISTNTEKEALLLEASLIKKHRPRYNIVLRDDKQYLLFRIQKGIPFPRLEIVRKANKDEAIYFGPFTSGASVRETWRFIHKIFPLRRCSDKVFNNRIRPCLYFYLNQCVAPCTEEVNPKEYAILIQKVVLFLSGKSKELIDLLQQDMLYASEGLEFEKAAKLRDQIQAIKHTIERQIVVSPEGGDIDIIGIAVVSNGLALGFLFVREGKLIDGRTFFWAGLELDDGPELLGSFLSQFYNPTSSIPPKIIVPWLPERTSVNDEIGEDITFETLKHALEDIRGSMVRIEVPKNTIERSLIDMAVTNAREAVQTKLGEPISGKLAKVFHSDKPINRIECVDVSHISGTNTRVGMVVFEDSQPLKSEYRIYSTREDGSSFIKGDDYAALASWAKQRIKSGPPWAELILIDGGRGQINAVQRVFTEQQVNGLFILAGIAKARNEVGRVDRRAGNVGDKIFISGRSNPLPLKEGSPELLFLQHVRDTAHNFVLGRHRKVRKNTALLGELLRIPGIGQATAKLLWSHFKTIEAMTYATVTDLESIPGIGEAKARMLAERLRTLRN